MYPLSFDINYSMQSPTEHFFIQICQNTSWLVISSSYNKFSWKKLVVLLYKESRPTPCPLCTQTYYPLSVIKHHMKRNCSYELTKLVLQMWNILIATTKSLLEHEQKLKLPSE